MKNGIIYCFIFLFIFQCAYSQNIDAYIAAPSGMNLRKTPSAKGAIVKKLPFATKVLVQITEPVETYKSKEADGFYLNGAFVKVLAGKDTGYVFDAFLLPFKPFTYSDYENIFNENVDNCKPTEAYLFEHMFGEGGGMFNVEKYTGQDTVFIADKNSKYCVRNFKQQFAGGRVEVEFRNYAEVGSGMTATFREGFPINFVYAVVLSYMKGDSADPNIIVRYRDKKIEIYPADEGAGCYSAIKVDAKRGVITWEYGCGC